MCAASFLDLVQQHRSVRKRSKACDNWKGGTKPFSVLSIQKVKKSDSELSENLAMLLCTENCCTEREQQSM